MTRFHHATLTGIVALTAVTIAGPVAVTARQSTERTVYVSVMNNTGAPVGDMKPEEFMVTEDGTPRTITKVERASEPLHYAILVDTTPAAGKAVNEIRAAVKAFCELLLSVEPKTEFLLMEFGGAAMTTMGFTSDIASVEASLGKMLPKPSESVMNEALVEISKQMAKMPPTSRRVILTINMEPTIESSGIQARQVAAEVRKSGAVVWSVVMMGNDMGRTSDLQDDSPTSRTRNTGGRDATREQLLNGLAANTGGRSLVLRENSFAQLGAYMRSIAANTFQQYAVTFSGGDEAVEVTDVKVSRPDVGALSMKWSSQ